MIDLEQLSNAEILRIICTGLTKKQRIELTQLLVLNREDDITPPQLQRLDELLDLNSRVIEATQVAITRGLNLPVFVKQVA